MAPGSKKYGSRQRPGRVRKVISGLLSAIIVFALIAGFLIFSPIHIDPLCKYTHTYTKLFCRGIIDVKPIQVNLDTLYVGLSDGSFPFDVHDPGSNYKQQAADDFNAGRLDDAIRAWHQAIAATTNDAESMIYIENAQVIQSKQPYVTIVVPSTLSEVAEDNTTSIDVARDDLKGIFVAQHEFNEHHANLKVRVVLANLGIKDQNYLAQTENPVLQQIIRLANTDDTFVGVVGFPFSSSAQIAISVLGAAHIPIISPSASSNALSNLSPYFFRVAPPDAEQGADAANFVSEVLHFHRVAVLSDNSNSYSQSLGESFANSFNQSGSGNVAITRNFTLHTADSLDGPLKDILSQNPSIDMIFLAGYADDMTNLKAKLGSNAATVQVMGGDAAYELGAYITTQGSYRNFFFTAFAYPDTWADLCTEGSSCASVAPAITNPAYLSKLFDPHNLHPESYRYSRAGPHVLLSYDGASILLQAVNAIKAYGASISGDTIKDALEQVSFQGSTGLISFSGSNPVHKALLVLCVDHLYHTKLVRVYGQFTPGTATYRPDLSFIKDILCA